MERVVVVGNCQAKAIELMLATAEGFSQRFEFASFPAVHEIPDEQVPVLHEAVAGAAVVLAQRVDEGYRDGIGLGTETLARVAGDATVVRWPSVYWAGYVPDLFYLRDAHRQPVVDGPFDYHDRTILEAYVDGAGVEEACRRLADPERPSAAAEAAAAATAELAVRGAGCDVDVAPYIERHHRERLLFFTMNHPANELLAHIAQQALEVAGIPGRVDPSAFQDELLGSTFYPLHANHVRALGLAFGSEHGAGTAPFRIRGVEYAPRDAVRAFYDYYDANPALVEINRAGADAA